MQPETDRQEELGIPTLYYRPGTCALAPHILLYWTEQPHVARHKKRDEEMDLLPENSAVADMMADYAVMRDQARSCQ